MVRKRQTLLSALVLAGGILLASVGTAWAGPPTEFIKENAKQVSHLLHEKESTRRQEKFTKKLHQVVDFRELSSRALGEYWQKRTPEEQQQFLDLLQQLLEANYRKKLEGKTLGEDYQIKYLDEKTHEDMAIVKTDVVWKDGSKPVSYKLLKKKDGWVVFDIIIDDISLVETYRDSYTAIIKKEGWDSLISRMKKKAAQIEAQKE